MGNELGLHDKRLALCSYAKEQYIFIQAGGISL